MTEPNPNTTPAAPAAPAPASAAAPDAKPGTEGAATGVDAAPSGLPKAPNLLAEAKDEKAPPPADDKGEGKDAKADEKKEGEEGKEPPALKPEDYKLKLPEGVAADDPSIKAYTEAAAKNKLSPEVAQALYDDMRPQIEAQLRQPYEAYKTLQEGWIGDVQKDPEIGGAKLPEVTARCARLMDMHGDPSLREALEITGAGNHPSVIRFFNKMAVAMKVDEGKPVNGGPVAPKPTSAQKMYPDGWQDARGGTIRS